MTLVYYRFFEMVERTSIVFQGAKPCRYMHFLLVFHYISFFPSFVETYCCFCKKYEVVQHIGKAMDGLACDLDLQQEPLMCVTEEGATNTCEVSMTTKDYEDPRLLIKLHLTLLLLSLTTR